MNASSSKRLASANDRDMMKGINKHKEEEEEDEEKEGEELELQRYWADLQVPSTH